MSVAAALRTAAGDFYRQSWRLVLLNAAVGLALAGVIAASLFVRIALVLGVFVGPLAAMLMRCCLTLVQTHELRLADAGAALRSTLRRGLVLGALAVAVVVVGIVAVPFYAGLGVWAWSLAALTAYLVAMFFALQLMVWPLALLEPERPLVDAFRAATNAALRRPLRFLGVGGAVLVVNVLGLVAGILPFFTLTIAYSFLVSAHFALPHTESEAEPWRVSPTTT
jgi:hypothetical protein